MITVYNNSSIKCITPEIIKRELEEHKDGRIYFVVPEFAKAQVEREIIKALNSDDQSVKLGDINVSSSFVNGDILSFIKLSASVLASAGVSLAGSANDILLRNVIYSILVKHREEFSTLHKLSGRFDYINLIIALLGDFSRYNIDSSHISEAVVKEESAELPNEEYIAKLKDMKLLMDYIGEVNEKYGLRLLQDPIGRACELLRSLKTDPGKAGQFRYRQLRSFLKAHFVFIGFGSTRLMTPKEYEMIELLSELDATVDIFALYPADKGDVSTLYKNGKEFTDKLKAGGALIKQSVFDESLSPVLKATSAYAFSDDSYREHIENIRLAEISGVDDRLGFIFHEIIRLTREEENIRYRDIKIVCCDDELVNRLRSVAGLYGLDIFIDRKILLYNTPVAFLVKVILELPGSHYSLDMVLKAMRSGLINIPPYLADVFDNYCRRLNITSEYRMFDPESYVNKGRVFVREGTVYDKDTHTTVPEGLYDDGDFFRKYLLEDKLEAIRDIADSIYHEENLSGKAALLMDFLGGKTLYIEALRDELSDAGKTDESVALVRGYDVVMDLLSGFMHEMNDVPISQKAFIGLINSDMKNKTEGTIPLKVDSVEITNPERAFMTPCKVMFIVGATGENFPFKRTADGLLSGVELKKLSSDISVDLPDKNESRTRTEYVTACLTLGACSERLYLVHEWGKHKSSVHEFLERFTELSEIDVNNYKTPVYGLPVHKRYDFTEAMIPPEAMAVLVEDRLNLSVSSMESFNSCHFKYMLEKVLKIRERIDNTEIRSSGIGTIVHKMLEIAVRDAVEKYPDPDSLRRFAGELSDSEDIMDKVSREVFIRGLKEEENEFPGALQADGSCDALFDRQFGIKIRRIFTFTFPRILEECAEQSFIPTGFETEIGDKGDIKLEFTSGDKKFSFSGYIDRFDTDPEDPSRFRIVDYKTGEKKIDFGELVEGVQIQLPTYANAIVRNNPDLKVSDYCYSILRLLPSSDPDKSYEMNINRSACSEEELKTALSYSEFIIGKSIERILKGEAQALAGSADACRYCSFSGMCGNKASDPVMRASYLNKFDGSEEIREIEESSQKNKKKAKAFKVMEMYLGEDNI